ncbi:MAG TPA: class I SAM-dependent methyltransferase, partial [Spirochaetota bacterium]|nr:class I SAM-dependent methyltransferase [Spirochaetota bacterium]
MKNALARQFRKPEGVLGSIISRLMAFGNRGAYEGVMRIMNLGGGERIFEIGYGPGDGIRTILASTDCSFRGIDFSPLMHCRAAKRNRTYVENGRAVFECGDFLDFKQGKEKYDRVFFINVIYFWKDIRKP